MAAEPDFGMDRAEMKKLLLRSKKEPVHCGLGMTKDGVVLMLDKIKQPKMLVKDLEKKFSDMKSPHWGMAFVDVEADPKLVILTLNKAAPGMARRMRKTLKGTGFSKVEIRLEDGSVAEAVGDEEEEGEAAKASPRPAAPTSEPSAAPSAPAGQAPADAVQAAAPPDGAIAALNNDLTALVKQMLPRLSADPKGAPTLKTLAAQGQSCLKAKDVAGAKDAIQKLREALGAAPVDMTKLDTARKTWTATRTKIELELGKLHKEMTTAYQDHGFGAHLDRVFEAKIQPMMHALDDSLAKKLDEVAKNQDQQQHAKLVGEAKQIVQRYESFVASEPLIAKLDKNPFVELHIQQTVTASLEALSKAIA